MRDLNVLENRKELLNDLRDFVKSKFKADFNIFIFGSFLTDNFVAGKSDLDLAIYTKENMMELDFLVTDFFEDKDISVDIIWIYPESNKCFVDIAPLAGYPLTEFYPQELTDHLAKLTFAFQREYEERCNNYSLYHSALERSILGE